MKAIVYDEYGPADVLELKDIDRPVVEDDGVLVRVRAAAANPCRSTISSCNWRGPVRPQPAGARSPRRGRSS